MAKLVRDKIPDIIRASGRTPVVTTLTADEFRAALCDKLHEEVAQLLAAQTSAAVVEEAADILEVLTAIAADHGATSDGIVAAAGQKRAQRGGFELKLSLHGCSDAEVLSLDGYLEKGTMVPMALNIKDESVHQAVKQIARITGESQAQAVATAVSERLTRVQQDDLARRLLMIGERTASRMSAQTKQLDHAELLYDQRGLPT